MFDFILWESDDPTVNAMFMLISPQIQENIRKYKNWKEPKLKQNESKTEAKQKQSKSKTQGNVYVNDNVDDNDNKNGKENEIYLFDDFWKLYPNKKWKPEAQKKYPHKDHEAIMVWLQNQIKEYEAKNSMKLFVPERQHWSTWINKKTRLDYQDTQQIEELNFEAIYQEYIKDYDNNYSENWKKKYWVSHEPESLFMRCKKRVKDEWLFKY